jgi:uncharacterized protein
MPQGAETLPGPATGGGTKVEQPLDLSRVAQDLQIRRLQVESVVQLLDEGNTVPFITRYRKERTGGLNEEVIRQIQARVGYLRQLAERKQTILKSIEGQGKLTDDLRAAILAADTSKRLEDLYLPYKPRKRTLSTQARERGLEPLALALWSREPAVANLSEVLPGMVNPEKGLQTTDDVLLGVQHILAEQIAETAEVRAAVRVVLWETGKLVTAKSDTLAEGQGLDYKDYFQFMETVRHIPPHRILAINRGEKEGPLKVHMEWDIERVRRVALSRLPLADHPHIDFLKKIVEDALSRLLLPSLEREIRRELTEESEEHAVRVFARNLRSLLLQPPLRGRRVLAIDPGFRTGCKVAALDEVGNLLEDTVIYPFGKGDKGRGRGAGRGDQSKAKAARAEATPLAVPAPTGTAEAASAPICPAATPAPVPAEAQVPMQESGPPQDTSVVATPVFEVAPAPSPPIEVPAMAPAAPAEEPTVAPAAVPEMAAAAAPTSSIATSLAAAPAPPAPAPGKEAKGKLADLIQKHQLNIIAIGNGTACRETEELVSELIAEQLPNLAYVIVNEAGASVYSASPIGREEFPNFDATLRGTISIGRRLQDPLSELVKIDPQNIGVGLYQHDIHPRRLKESLEAVIESCVNHVGVDLNTASVPLLRHVSGLNQLAARELVDFRKQHGPFKSREQLLQVAGIGPARYVQAAGFLKVIGGDNPLDQTWIHPESYPLAQRLLGELGTAVESLPCKEAAEGLQTKLKAISVDELGTKLTVGAPTLRDLVEALARPGRDPREDLPPPIFKKGILKLEDLQPGMELKGTVLNVVDFGAFVDIGLKDSGLVHISQMANRYVKNPYDVVAVGDVVTIWIMTVDKERRRVSLTMIRPGSERKPTEKKPLEQRPPQQQQQRRDRPPPRRRPGPAPGQQSSPPRQGHAGAPQEQNQQPAAKAPPPASKGPPPGVKVPPGQPAALPPRPALRPRKPHREPPKPKLSKAALEGTSPLRTFSELKAFFEAQQKEPAPPPPPPPSPPPPPPEEMGNGASASPNIE